MIKDEPQSKEENRNIIVLPWDVEAPEWIRNSKGEIEPISNLSDWFEAVKPQATVPKIKGLDGEDHEEKFEFNALNDFELDGVVNQSEILKDIDFLNKECAWIEDERQQKRLKKMLGE